MGRILVVDDEQSMRQMLEILFREAGWEVRSGESAAEALEHLRKFEPDVVVTDVKMKGTSGLELLKAIKTDNHDIEVIVITAYASDSNALEALKLGAYDYVAKPFDVEELKVVAARALERRRLLQENLRMRAELQRGLPGTELVGTSARMQEVYRTIEKVAPTRANVLITGESGTGKEVVARAIHRLSQRASGPFVPVDCAAIPATLMESELFGAMKGAFTGATSDRAGLFELASGGTVFLDEVGEIPLELQVKLLRVLEQRTVRRLGDSRDRQIDVRVVAATNQDLERLVGEGKFRQDLFFRLNVVHLHLPALRERLKDIKPLAIHFARQLAQQEGAKEPVILPEAFGVLESYDFPGNVRELKNIVERAVALSGGRP
ncbi:MAG: sigma-54-dependent Fis family transcriptional regulator, partial [Deltaproteobacteria bacterium]